MKAVEKRLTTGTMFGMPHDMEWRTGGRDLQALSGRDGALRQSSGTEATMHAIRLARAATGRDKIRKV